MIPLPSGTKIWLVTCHIPSFTVKKGLRASVAEKLIAGFSPCEMSVPKNRVKWPACAPVGGCGSRTFSALTGSRVASRASFSKKVSSATCRDVGIFVADNQRGETVRMPL